MDWAEIGMSSISAHETIFPLNHHSKMLVVEQQHFNGKVFTVASCQLLNVHLEAAVTIDIDHQRVRVSRLDSHRCRQPKAHCSKPTTAEPGSRTTEFEELSSPHLMLTNAHGNVGIHVGGDVAQGLDCMLLKNAVKVLVIFQWMLSLQILAVTLPLSDFRCFNNLIEVF